MVSIPAGMRIIQKEMGFRKPYVEVRTPSKRPVLVFNPEMKKTIQGRLEKSAIERIQDLLALSLQIQVNRRGFVPAAVVSAEEEDTNYGAVWVRDSVWAYYKLKADKYTQEQANQLLLALWDYYATADQIARFKGVIDNPKLSFDKMAMPHIRFDGESDNLGDVMRDGKPEDWNHRQIDAHGLFFTALAHAFFQGGLTTEDLTPKRFQVLSLYPLFLKKINYSSYEDAGAWEELPRKNTSSIGLAAGSLRAWQRLAYLCGHNDFHDKFFGYLSSQPTEERVEWENENLAAQISSGLRAVHDQLRLGGESPDYDRMDLRYRKADAALLFLLVPSPLEGLEANEISQILNIVLGLARPFGIIRYENDVYQSGNYWFKAEEGDRPALTGDASSLEDFSWRSQAFISGTEAQWFFDSLLAWALFLREKTPDKAPYFLKRALGQVTGYNQLNAKGWPVIPWGTPESINTVIIGKERYFLPSPITPLNWAKAGLDLALRAAYEKALLA